MFWILWLESHDWNAIRHNLGFLLEFFWYDSICNDFLRKIRKMIMFDWILGFMIQIPVISAIIILTNNDIHIYTEESELIIDFKINRLLQNFATDLRFVFKSNLHRLLHRLQIWDWFSNQKFYGWIGPDWITQFRILQMSSIVTSCRQLSLWTVDYHRLSSFVIRCHQQSSCDYLDYLWLSLTILTIFS